MKILIADDDAMSRQLLSGLVTEWGHEPVTAENGEEAWQILTEQKLQFIIVDWMMPRLTGVNLCERIRASELDQYIYIILLTSRKDADEIVTGLNAGADDYVTKPFDARELEVRLNVGIRVLDLERRLEERARQAEEQLQQINKLESLIPICCECRQVRDDKNYWHKVETYLAKRTPAKFTHTLCPHCYNKAMAEIEAA